MQINDRITYITIMEKEYPLCLNIRAQNAFRKAFSVGITGIDKLLTLEEDGSNADLVYENFVKILEILLMGGRTTVRIRARLAGEEVPEIPEITADDLQDIYTMADMAEPTRRIYEAMNSSFRQDVEAKPVKNAEEAAQPVKKSG